MRANYSRYLMRMPRVLSSLATLMAAAHPISAARCTTSITSHIMNPPSRTGRENIDPSRGSICSTIQHRRRSVLDAVVSDLFRGGDDRSSNYNNNYAGQGNFHGMSNNIDTGNEAGGNDAPNMNPVTPSQIPHPPFQQPFATGNGEFMGGYNANEPIYDGYRESVEDRLAAWRLQQQQLHEFQSPEQAASAVDEQGRFKLFTTVSRVSVSFFFFILMWRTVHHYELADAAFGTSRGSGKGGVRAALLRSVVVTPLVILFLGEMMGAILGLTGGGIGGGGASHATKKRLKGILNLHKGVELVMLIYNVVRLAIWPSRYVMREVYIGRTISNFFFLMQAQLYTKLSW
eukprot:CCRYP_019640-RA/>CCRYP_019640-RA protein AED:0.04 eAED:0.04 QI:307/1/1/1/1/1/2/580/344